MKQDIERLKAGLRAANPDDPSFFSRMEEFVQEAEKLENPTSMFRMIIELFEANPQSDFGCPGPLVHFIEAHYPKYLGELKNSIGRFPTPHTLWMLNRVLNSRLTVQDRSDIMSILRSASENPRVGEEVRDCAIEFLKLQQE
jgi:hypothetical protein